MKDFKQIIKDTKEKREQELIDKARANKLIYEKEEKEVLRLAPLMRWRI